MVATSHTNTTLAAIAAEMLKCTSFALCGHVSPDGDCMGSALALTHALKACGKRVVCLSATDEPLDATLATLPGADEVVAAQHYDEDVEAFISVDVPTLLRIGDAVAVYKRATVTFSIDHHASETRMADWCYIDSDAASTTMLVWELIHCLGVKPSPDIAQCAYTGLMTDTGGFRFQNATGEVFALAAEMLGYGADPARAACDFFQNRSLASFALSRVAFQNMRLLGEDSSLVLAWISEADMQKTGATRADAEPIIDELRSIRGIRVACLLREHDGTVRGSLRAKDTTNVARIAQMFGGGGNAAAAGCTLTVSLSDAIGLVTAALEQEAGRVS